MSVNINIIGSVDLIGDQQQEGKIEKTLDELARENKLSGQTAFDFKDIQDIIDGKKDSELI
jgi:hypothetical protein